MAPTLVGREPCGTLECHHLSLTLTPEQLDAAATGLGAIAEAGGTEPSGSPLPPASRSAGPANSGTMDVWVQTSDLRLTRVSVAVAAGDQGSVAIDLVLSNYDAAVTINAPPDSEIEAPVGVTPPASQSP